MDKDVLFEKIKTARAHRFLTNCYSADVIGKCDHVWSMGENLVFSYDDHGINRLIFISQDWDSLDEVLTLVDHGKYYLEFMTKDPDEYTPKGAKLTARMLRLANADCRDVFEQDSPILRYRNSTKTELATESDAVEINRILWDTFSTEISHLLTDEEVREKIVEGQFSVHRDDAGHIDALLQADVLPKKFYINQVINRSQKNVIHAILLSRLEQYISSGGKYLFAWVEDKNIASRKFHEKYGMKHDGMWDVIYCVEKR